MAAPFDIRFRLVRDGSPAPSWVVVVDDDVVLHDLLASGATAGDATVRLRFRDEVIRQQPWERETVPDLVIRVWPGAASPPPADVAPVLFRIPARQLTARDVDLGDLDLASALPARAWWLQQLNVSPVPGLGHTEQTVGEIAADVLPVVRRACRAPNLRPVPIRLADLPEGTLGAFSAADRTVEIARWPLPVMSDDALRRLLAHELAHAAAADVADPRRVPAHVVEQAAWYAHHEGYAHYVEQIAAEAAFPLTHVDFWDHALDVSDVVVPTALEPLTRSLRRLGLAWFRREAGGEAVRYRASGYRKLVPHAAELLAGLQGGGSAHDSPPAGVVGIRHKSVPP